MNIQDQQRFARDMQLAAFAALVQQMVASPDRVYDFQRVLNETAQALNINEQYAFQLIQHCFDKQEEICGLVQAQGQLDSEWLDNNFKPQEPPKKQSFWQKVDKNVLRDLKLYEQYERFHNILKNGCELKDLIELREAFAQGLQEAVVAK